MSLPIILTVTEAVAASRRHRDTLLAALRTGALKGFQSGKGGTWRMAEEDLAAWMRGE